MVKSNSSMGIFGLMMHQFVPSLRLMHLPVPTSACQSLVGPFSTLRRVMLCQFSAYLVLAAISLLVEGSRSRPRIHLSEGYSSGRTEKAIKKCPFAVFLVPKL